MLNVLVSLKLIEIDQGNVSQAEQIRGDRSDQEIKEAHVARIGTTQEGLRVGARRGGPGGWGFAHGIRPSSAQRSDTGPPSSRPTTCRKVCKGPVLCDLGGGRGRGSQSLDYNYSVYGDMKCHFAEGGWGESPSLCGRLSDTGYI